MHLTQRFGHTAVRALDTPGFIVNHAGRGYGTEGLRVLAEGVCEPAVLDAVLRDACGFKLGPCELLDLTGLENRARRGRIVPARGHLSVFQMSRTPPNV